MADKLKKRAKDATGIQAPVLQSLVSAANGIKSDLASKQGDLGSHVKKAEDVHGVHRKAFSDTCKLARMDEGKRSEYLRALDDYRDKLNLNPHPDMFADKDDGEAEGEEGDEQKRRRGQAAKAEQQDQAADNAAALKGGIKPLEAVH